MNQEFRPNAWLVIAPDDRITVLCEKPELGQGSRTYIPMMIAEELEADWSKIRVEQAPTLPSIYKGLRTGGSGGVVNSFDQMRRAGAQAREMLVTAAAQEWSANRSDCRAENGSVVHVGTQRRLRYGELASKAAKLPLLGLNNVALKPFRDFHVVGTSVPRTDVPSKVDGTAKFGFDVRLPGMLYAVIARCPHFGGSLQAFDASAAKQIPGVKAIFAVPPLPRKLNTAGGVAVVADSNWRAMAARKQLKFIWKKGSREADSRTLRQSLERATRGEATYVAVDRGNALEVLSTATRKLEASYESPFQAHATMEPMNTTVQVREKQIEVWSPTQFADEVQQEIAQLAGLPSEQVIVHMTLSGGSFGRRYQWDYAAEAWQVAKNFKAPVQLLWTREDDMQHDFYRPYNFQYLSAALGSEDKPLAWSTRVVTTPIAETNVYSGYDESPEALKNPATVAALEWYGADVVPYDIANFRLDYAPVMSPVPRSWWRSVASSYTPFAKESFLDELAHLIGRDPLQFRLDLLANDSPNSARVRNVLQIAGKAAGWGQSLPSRQGRGIACFAGDTCNAQIADVSVDDDGTVHVIRVTSVVDCGLAVSPDGVRAMTEGAINFALTAVLTGEITIKDSAVEQSNFHDYQVLRIHESPEVDVHIVPSLEPPSGVGELGAMLVAPAVANAIFAATGVRIRRLPVDSALLQKVHS
ncbi:MAG TPA: xanthine dehydrogenase family protein molybdopterin-binding subunit [Terriglobales bacterium]|nr:xanthine dehydrogenase family protein molybdopterin-binding subunit [Terriglobales bacterium]